MLVHNLFYDDTMDLYRPNDVGNDFSSQLEDVMPSELDFFQGQTESKEDMTSYAATMPPLLAHHDSNGSQDSYNSGSHGYVPAMDCPRPEYSTSLPCIDTSAVDWLQRVSTCPPAHSTGSNIPSVHGASAPTEPANVQISCGNLSYAPRASVAMYMSTSSAQPVYMSPSNPTEPQDSVESEYRSRSNSNNSSYALSPGSAAAENLFPKPAYSYSCLIALALKNSQHGSLPVAEIYSFMTRHFPYFKTAPDGWKNSVRHNLSLNKCFEKIENPNADGTNSRKGCLWALNPAKVKKMDEEICKWNKKDPMAIKRAMVHPEMLERLTKGQESFTTRASTMRQVGHRQHHVHHETRLSVMDNMTAARGSSVTVGQPPHMYMDQSTPASDAFPTSQQMDVSPSHISVQNGLFDGLPAELFEYVCNPASFTTSANTSTCHSGQALVRTELPAVQNNLPPATMISLAQN